MKTSSKFKLLSCFLSSIVLKRILKILTKEVEALEDKCLLCSYKKWLKRYGRNLTNRRR